MKNIQVIDGAENCVYDIFQVPDKDFRVIFDTGTDIAFIEDLAESDAWSLIEKALTVMWNNRIPKTAANGIHGVLFYKLLEKKQYYPTLVDEDAVNPGGSKLRR